MYEWKKDGEENAFTETVRSRDKQTVYNGNDVASVRTDATGNETGNADRPLLGDSTGNSAARTETRAEARARVKEASDREIKEAINKAKEEIDPLALPYVLMPDKAHLPRRSGVYFVIERGGCIAYIGESKDIRGRWNAHHATDHLKSARTVKIAWLEIPLSSGMCPFDRIKGIERAMIEKFKPRLNWTYNNASCKGPSAKIMKEAALKRRIKPNF